MSNVQDLLDKSPANNHYQGTIQPINFVLSNRMLLDVANSIKYVNRYPRKNGCEDLEKALWYIDVTRKMRDLEEISLDDFLDDQELSEDQSGAISCLYMYHKTGFEIYLDEAEEYIKKIIREEYHRDLDILETENG